MKFVWLLALVVPAFAAVDGTVVNETTGKPQPGVVLQLVQPGQSGMQTLGSAKTDSEGKFKFDNNSQGGPRLLQAIYKGVLYNKMIPPGTPSSGLEIPVFDSSDKPNGAKITQHFIVIQPAANQVSISESFLYQGDPKLTYNDPAHGTLRFYLPDNATQPQVEIQTTGGMPVARTAEKTNEPNVYKIDYPVKPGETRFDVNYSIPGSTPMTLEGKVVQNEGQLNLVAPNGVTLKGDNLEPLGQEPKTQATIYRVNGNSYKIEVTGTGSLDAGNAGSEDNNGAPTLEVVNPRIYEKLYWILGFTFGILGLAAFLLYRNGQRAS